MAEKGEWRVGYTKDYGPTLKREDGTEINLNASADYLNALEAKAKLLAQMAEGLRRILPNLDYEEELEAVLAAYDALKTPEE